MADKINFENKINDSAQVGDEVFVSTTSSPTPILIGTILSIGDNFIEIDYATGVSASDISSGNFISFQKTQNNMSSLKGYYAKVKMSINSANKAELFSLGSEVVQSSKYWIKSVIINT